ncbi:MAG: hypothetical protein ABSG60_13430 [Terracidiphilus sp.]|jgi:hypothetical protein
MERQQLERFWTGRAVESMPDLYDKMEEDVEFRRKWAEKCGFGFELCSFAPIVPKTEEKDEAKKAA